MKKNNNEYSFKHRIKYWLDCRMAKGTGSMIRILSVCTVIVILLIAFLIFFLGLKEEGGFSAVLWDSFATTINAWMPYSEEGGPGYILLTAISAIVGVLFTSILIGIISTAIEDKVSQLRKGNSIILEKGHTVVLGFEPGKYTLIRELIKAAGDEKRCIVVAADMEKDEMEDLIRENIDIPSNIKLFCRKADVTDPQSLKCCSIPDSKVVAINYGKNDETVRTVLAVYMVLKGADALKCGVNVISAISDEKYKLPRRFRVKTDTRMLQTKDIIARVLSHSATQPGISHVIKDVLTFDGCAFYDMGASGYEGMSFGNIVENMHGGVPIGILRDESCIVNPSSEICLQEGDRIIFFAESKSSASIIKTDTKSFNLNEFEEAVISSVKENDTSVLVIGYNDMFQTLLSELPKSVKKIVVTGITIDQKRKITEFNNSDRQIVFPENLADAICDKSEENMEKLVQNIDHVIVLSNRDIDENDADMETMLTIINLRDIKKRLQLPFSITAEMISEKDRNLIKKDDMTDFIIASDMSSMAISQMTENPKFYGLFKEILSNDGNEFFLETAGSLDLAEKQLSVSEIRTFLYYRRHSIFIGYLRGETEIVMNPTENSQITFSPDDKLFVLCER